MRTTQVAVVGGGPAGLAAATAAARAGAETVLLDEQSTLGGQLRYRVAAIPRPPAIPWADAPASGPEWPVRPGALAADLVAAAHAAGVDARPGAVAWGLFEDGVLAVAGPAESYRLRGERVVIATGSTDLPRPFPGGSLPGVLSARALQILLHVHRVRPGRRFVVLGQGAEAAEVTADIGLAGGEVVAVLDPERADLAAEGTDGVVAVTTGGVRHAADVVVVAVGRQPDAALALMVGCPAALAPTLGGWVPDRDADGRTANPAVWVAGDAGGTCDVGTAVAEGALVGTAVAASLGLVGDEAVAAARLALRAAALERVETVAALDPAYAQI